LCRNKAINCVVLRKEWLIMTDRNQEIREGGQEPGAAEILSPKTYTSDEMALIIRQLTLENEMIRLKDSQKHFVARGELRDELDKLTDKLTDNFNAKFREFKDDFKELKAGLKADVAAVKAELKADVAAVKGRT
jgi:hypothetical protein